MYTLQNKDTMRAHLIAYAEKWIATLPIGSTVALTHGIGSAGHTFHDLATHEFVAKCSRQFDIDAGHDFSPGPLVAQVQRGKYDYDYSVPGFVWAPDQVAAGPRWGLVRDFVVYDGPFPIAVCAAYPCVGTHASCQ